jgi:hypothetical protein
MGARRSGSFARSYPALLISFTLVMWPSTGPVLHRYRKAFVIASRSSVMPTARRANSFKSLPAVSSNHCLKVHHLQLMERGTGALDEVVSGLEQRIRCQDTLELGTLNRSGARRSSHSTCRVSERRLGWPRVFSEDTSVQSSNAQRSLCRGNPVARFHE